MNQKGKCSNYAGCVLAYRGEEITVSDGPFVCPECGRPLQPCEGGGGAKMKPAVVTAIASGVGLLVLIAMFALGGKKEKKQTGPTSLEAQSDRVAAEQAEAPPKPVATTKVQPVTEKAPAATAVAPAKPVARQTPVAAPAPNAVPDAATAPAATAVKPNLDPGNEENRTVKSEVLRRIDLMPTISSENKDRLYMSVERARQMGRMISVPFGSGRTSLSVPETENLRRAIQSPQLKDVLSDPTAVFVILGYADTKGDEKKNQQISEERAKHVLNTLRDKCGIQNLMHSVGMGGSTLFDASGTEKNRVSEVWVVLP